MKDKSPVLISLGSNLGDREVNLERAIRAIARLAGTSVVGRSQLYESAPWGPVPQPDYLNMAIEVSTTLEPDRLLRAVKAIERSLGRAPGGVRWGPRVVDIDILTFGALEIETPLLRVPHRRMWERRFVLLPIADIAPNLLGPGGESIVELLRRDDIAAQKVRPYTPGRSESGLDEES
jgi:2-amino-4-hydroxy-6-hydroxymethyldihydropteridine diphosphokinase